LASSSNPNDFAEKDVKADGALCLSVVDEPNEKLIFKTCQILASRDLYLGSWFRPFYGFVLVVSV